jgi:flavin-dependent dehydrogenase
MQTIPFDPGSIPVTGSYDVLVAGGGTAGAFAGISAARMGARTLIVEQYGAPGGSATMALVTPVMHSHITGDPQSSALADEARARMAGIGAAMDAGDADKGWFDPLALKFVLEQMIEGSGCEILYHTAVIGAVRFDVHPGLENKSGDDFFG